ncbi:hypothetical protein [Microseira sp. BLCC-F43]|uniref:hypothetical protein n=1 Tax=Microseira sp. BLCC-F43 TaxID=3153602 RepID=UPI0035BC73EB
MRRGKRRLRRMEVEYEQGKIELSQVTQSLQSWVAHLNHGDTWKLRQQIFAGTRKLVFYSKFACITSFV